MKYLVVILSIVVLYFVISIFVMQDNEDYARKVFQIGTESKIENDSLKERIKTLKISNDSLINLLSVKDTVNGRSSNISEE